jgi:hypothetical protein
MEFLKKLPALLQQHYEKVLLGLALTALALAGVLLASQKQKEEEELKKYGTTVSKRTEFAYAAMTWSVYMDALKKATNTFDLDFGPPQLLFNPVKWQRSSNAANGEINYIKIEKGNEVGPEALIVTGVTPLYLTIALEKPAGAAGYFMSVTRDAAANVALRRKRQFYLSLNGKDPTGTFVLKEVKGDPDNPELVVELLDTAERASLTKDKPFQRIDAYKADLKYPPENKTFTDRRRDDSLTLGSEDYILVVISPQELIVSARSNAKRTILKYSAPR